MIDKRIPCTRDCQERSATCKCACERYKEYRQAKEEEYKKRAHVCEGYPDSPQRKKALQRKMRRSFKGH